MYWIPFYTILRREVQRFMRIWTQTLLPPVITQSLYFLIFGNFIGSRISGEFTGGLQYIQFVVPGLVMMGVINSSFANVVSSFFGAKFQKNLEELQVAPVPNWVIISGFSLGGTIRGVLVGIIVFLVSIFFARPQIYNIFIILIFVILTALVFSLAGLINGIFAKKFDDIGIFQTFILTPLTYLGGIFYPIDSLPPFWQNVSMLNPIVYMIDGFRYGFFGVSDFPIQTSFSLLLVFTFLFSFLAWYLMKQGTGLKS
jgi:ABC-2 type transport system permease protein